jgi:hypothetical protein
MAETEAAVLIVVIGLAVIAGGVALLASNRMPVTFKNLDEEQQVYQTARWAAKQLDIKPGDPRLRYSLWLWMYSANFNWMGSIPAEELTLLAPFINLVIDGKGPPLKLPPEYDNRPETLGRFKRRMQAERLWPQSQS